MIRYAFSLLLTSTLLGACNVGTEKTTPTKVEPVAQTEPSLAAFNDTLRKLSAGAPMVLEQAVALYDLLAPHDSTGADSAASALMRFTEDVVKSRNDSLNKSKEDVSFLVGGNDVPLTDRQKALMSSLHANRLKPVTDGEGGVYLVPAYETILPTIKARTSAAVDDYLDLAAKQDTSPVFLDAGLAIELTDLADRLALSEKLIAQPLPRRFAAEAEELNQFYTDAFLFGADNSPALLYNTTTLDENYKKGYDYLLAKYPGTKAAATTNVWLAVVASGDEKKIAAFQQTRR